MPHLLGTISCPLPAEDVLLIPTPDASVSRYNFLFSLQNFTDASHAMVNFAHSYSFSYILFDDHSVFVIMFVFMPHILLQWMVQTLLGSF